MLTGREARKLPDPDAELAVPRGTVTVELLGQGPGPQVVGPGS